VIYSYYVTAVINNAESIPSNKIITTSPPSPVVGFGKINGHLYDDTTKAPIAMGNIIFIPGTSTIPASTSASILGGKSDNNGNFSTSLKPGTYYLYSSGRGYIGEFYDNARTIQNATKIILKAGDSLFFDIGLTKGNSSVLGTVGGGRGY
jgi:hypothetical protein